MNKYEKEDMCRLTSELEEAQRRAEKGDKFKAFVHKRLDDLGVPADPFPEETKKHGCRISGRLDWLYKQTVPALNKR